MSVLFHLVSLPGGPHSHLGMDKERRDLDILRELQLSRVLSIQLFSLNLAIYLQLRNLEALHPRTPSLINQRLKRYWEDFHSCTVTALTDCQEGAKDMWDKLRKESKNLNIQGSLFELCGSGNGAAGSLLPALPVLLASLSAALATWLSF
uniref:Neuritin 1 n=1 Tax=Rhinolophus ferrumequinum TaxID=59479 RepID=A0A671DNL1_RHIFE